ncbi:HAD family hydrolase, partial [Cellulosimicrobium cellulans]|nr:HAD family hydrolase [Cellulosimicrobium cellulans]
GVASARAAGCAVLVVTGTHTADELASASPAPDALAAGLARVRFAAGPDGIRVTDA